MSSLGKNPTRKRTKRKTTTKNEDGDGNEDDGYSE
jgi:hypothetical protein